MQRITTIAPAFLLAVSILVGSGLAGGSSSPRQSSNAPNDVYWGYEGRIGPRFWGEISPGCAGSHQSPIDINQPAVQKLPEIDFNYQPTPLKMINNGHSIEVTYAKGSSIEIEGENFVLERFHFHSPSEHTIRGRHYPLEMHLVHSGPGVNGVVVGVFIDIGRHNRALAE